MDNFINKSVIWHAHRPGLLCAGRKIQRSVFCLQGGCEVQARQLADLVKLCCSCCAECQLSGSCPSCRAGLFPGSELLGLRTGLSCNAPSQLGSTQDVWMQCCSLASPLSIFHKQDAVTLEDHTAALVVLPAPCNSPAVGKHISLRPPAFSRSAI